MLVIAALLRATSAFGLGQARTKPATPQGSLYDVWLDLRLVGIFYPKTTA